VNEEALAYWGLLRKIKKIIRTLYTYVSVDVTIRGRFTKPKEIAGKTGWGTLIQII